MILPGLRHTIVVHFEHHTQLVEIYLGIVPAGSDMTTMEESSVTYEQLNDLSAEFDGAETELSTLSLCSYIVVDGSDAGTGTDTDTC